MSALHCICDESRSRVKRDDTRAQSMSGITDVLIVGADRALGHHLSGLFRRFGWSVARTSDCAAAARFLSSKRAAVALCEERLQDGVWQDLVLRMGSLENPPALVVLADAGRLKDVIGCGGFDVLTRPLREADVVWTIATAWDNWMRRFERNGNGAARCSDA